MLAGKIGYFRATAHPEALAWQTRVIANGGTVSASTLAAVSTFCAAIDTAGIRDRFYRLNLICGSNLAASLVPLYRGRSQAGAQVGGNTDTNNNFVSGDYVEANSTTGGLKSDGSTKYLDTGLNLVSVGASVTDVHLSAYVCGTESAGTSRYVMSSWSGGSGGPGLGWLGGGSQERFHYPASNAGNTTARQSLIGGSVSASAGTYYVNGTAVGSVGAGGSGGFQNQSIYVFASNSFNNNPALFLLSRYVRAYSVGLSMSSSQWSAYNTAMQAFQTSLARNV